MLKKRLTKVKQLLRHIFLLIAILIATTNLWAQTYNDGTWYSLYADTEYTLNTIDNKTLDAFTPVGTTLSFKAKRDPLGLGNLKIAPIVGGAQQDPIFNQNPGEVTEKYAWYVPGLGGQEKTVAYKSYTADITNKNSNQIKFYTEFGATLKKYFNSVKLPLAPHVLLKDGTSYGTTSLNADNQTSLATSVGVRSTNSYTIPLRSFLLASGKTTLTIKSSNSEFHFNDGSVT